MATTNDLTELAATLARLAAKLAEADTEPQPPPARIPPERVMLTVEEAAERLNVGRTTMFKLIRRGDVETIQIGRLRRVPVSSIQNYAARLVHESTANAA